MVFSYVPIVLTMMKGACEFYVILKRMAMVVEVVATQHHSNEELELV